MRFRKIPPRETQHTKYDCQDGKAADLDGLAPDFVDGEDGEPVAWQCAGADEDNLPGGGVAEVEVEVGALVESHC